MLLNNNLSMKTYATSHIQSNLVGNVGVVDAHIVVQLQITTDSMDNCTLLNLDVYS